MLRRLSVRGKILTALAVPVLVLLLAASFISYQAISQARVAGQTNALITALSAQDAAMQAMAAERTATIEAAADPAKAVDLTAARQATDKALTTRDSEFKDLNLAALDSRVDRAVTQAMGDKKLLTQLRDAVDSKSVESDAKNQYSSIIESAIDVQSVLADTSPNRALAQYLGAYTQADQLIAQITLEQPVVAAALADSSAAAGTINPTTATLVSTGNTLAQNLRDTLHALPDSGSLPQWSPWTDAYLALRNSLAASSPEVITPANATQWDKLTQGDLDEVTAVRDAVREQTEQRADAMFASARNQAIVTIAIALIAIVLSLVIAWVIARAIVQPLHRLTRATEDVRDQLPSLVEQVAVPGQGPRIGIAPITVESYDEVGQLARAFNDVNATTIKVAREQAALRGSIAEMFVNVARRDQVLLNRQLAFLDDLERTEEDPNTLSNLFRLDHLATRMRRNAESLLVLAGIDSGRRVRQPMPASDVIRTASSEIELYDRVRLNLVVDPLMLGHNALNAAHLIAELLENATMFSEPHTPVEVTTGRDDNFVYIKVRDHGLGMTPEEIADANRRVKSHEASEVVGAQRLGLYVVGRLAGRLDAQVEFAPGPFNNGTEVTVALPASLFVPEAKVPLPQPTDPLDIGARMTADSLYGPSWEAGGSGAALARSTDAGLPTRGDTSPTQANPLPSRTSRGEASPGSAPPTRVPTAEPPASLPGGYDTSLLSADEPAYTPDADYQPLRGRRIAEPEPPVVKPVDLDALTDGTTTTGMPRRRKTVETNATPTVSLREEGPLTGSIVLPPLATPTLPDVLPDDDPAGGWTPPQTASGSALPSRKQTRPIPAAEPPAETPMLDVGTRSALFSSFRSLAGPDSSQMTGHLDLEPATQVTATGIDVVPDVNNPALTGSALASETAVWTPAFKVDADTSLVRRDGAGELLPGETALGDHVEFVGDPTWEWTPSGEAPTVAAANTAADTAAPNTAAADTAADNVAPADTAVPLDTSVPPDTSGPPTAAVDGTLPLPTRGSPLPARALPTRGVARSDETAVEPHPPAVGDAGVLAGETAAPEPAGAHGDGGHEHGAHDRDGHEHGGHVAWWETATPVAPGDPAALQTPAESVPSAEPWPSSEVGTVEPDPATGPGPSFGVAETDGPRDSGSPLELGPAEREDAGLDRSALDAQVDEDLRQHLDAGAAKPHLADDAPTWRKADSRDVIDTLVLNDGLGAHSVDSYTEPADTRPAASSDGTSTEILPPFSLNDFADGAVHHEGAVHHDAPVHRDSAGGSGGSVSPGTTSHIDVHPAVAAPDAEPVPAEPGTTQPGTSQPGTSQPGTTGVGTTPGADDLAPGFTPLPKFEELMSDLPTRRSLRESSPRRRGLFGRRSRPSTPEASREAGQLGDWPHKAPWPVPAPAPDAAPEAGDAADAGRTPEAGPELDGKLAETGVAGQVTESGLRQFAPPAYSVPPEPAVTDEPGQPASGWERPEPAINHEPGQSASAADTMLMPPLAADGTGAPADGGLGPWDRPAATDPLSPLYEPEFAAPEPRHSGATAQEPDFGPPKPLTRRHAKEALEPLDPQYISDSVEARSEWMASAILYEEMTSLLRSSSDTPSTGAPSTVADPLPTRRATDAALGQRSPMEGRDGYVDRFTASIDRDPEQLRARLSAFQSATARGRAEAPDEISSTQTPATRDHVR